MEKNVINYLSIIWYHTMYSLQIRMITEGSCDTKEWSNDADISALPSQEYIPFSKYTYLKIIVQFNKITVSLF